MKKTIIILIFVLFLPLAQYAFHIEAGISYGPRKINDTKIKNIYGEGSVFSPYLSVHLGKGIFAGFGYEGGRSKSGTIGLYHDPTTFKIYGMEFFLGCQKRIKFILPFVKIGCGPYFYQQTFESPYLKDFQVNDHQWALTFDGGIKFIILKGAFLCGEIKYILLKVRPFGEKIDLGGIRFLAGIGYFI